MSTFARLQKIGVSLAMVVIASGTLWQFYAPQHAPRAHAIDAEIVSVGHVPGSIIAKALVGTAAASSATAGSTGTETFIMKTLNGIAWQAAKLTIQLMTRSIITWINSGYKGSPSFVTNLDRTLLAVANTSADLFLRQLAMNGAIHSPFQNTVAAAVGASYNRTANGGFFATYPYTLNQVTKNDAAFLAGNFSQGGWNAWLSAVMNQQNNPLGAQILATNALNSQVAGAQATRATELGWAKGFLSWRGSCAASGDPTSGAGGGQACKTDDDCAGTLACILGVCRVDSTLDTPVSLAGGDQCLAYNIQTPGSVVEAQLENTLGSPIRQLELANSINEIIGAAVTQMVTQVLGSTGLFGLSQPTAAGSTVTPLSQATNPAAYAGSSTSISQGFVQDISSQLTKLSAFSADWQTIENAAVGAKTALSSSSCYPDPTGTIQTQVQPIIDAATQNLAVASSSAAVLQNIQGEVASAQVAAPADQVTALQGISQEYQSYLASPGNPADADFAYAEQQSADTATTTPVSLYTSMTQLAKQASCIPGT